MTIIQKILMFFGFYQPEVIPPQEDKPNIPLEGTSGFIKADSVIGREADKMALVVDFEFGDIPSWVEWDVDLKQISIAQHGGAVAILKTVLSEKEARDFESTDHLMLCTKIGTERIVHRIPLILRESNDNSEEKMIEFGQELAV